MIQYKDSPFNYDLPVIPLNSSGVCNKGLALEMKRRYPYAAMEYKRTCIKGEFLCGSLYIHEDKDGFGNIHQMIWAGIGGAKLYEIETAIKNIAALPQVDQEIKEIVLGGFKPLGSWGDIKFFLKRHLQGIPAKVIIIEEDIKNEIIDNMDFRDAWRRR